jgi:HSP20 family protein
MRSFYREMNRLFDDAFRNFDRNLPAMAGSGAWSAGWPNIEISQTDGEVRVTADMPGLEEKDVEVTVEDNVLTLRGEKRSETDDKDRNFSERFYGRFERQIPLGAEVDEDKATASFRNGVLTIALPKSADARTRAKRIAINQGAQQTH